MTGSGTAEGKIPGNALYAGSISGNYVGISGDTAAIGYHGIIGSSVGHVTVSVWNACTSAWETQQVVTGTGVGTNDAFGSSLNLSGDSLFVGANLHDIGGGSSGALYSFTRSGTTWTQIQNIAPPTGAGAKWGFSLGRSGNTLAVGAPLGKDPTSVVTYTGVVSVLTKNPSGMWSSKALLVPSTAVSNDAFGYSVGVDSTQIISGATGSWNYAGTSPSKGKAWIFSGSAASWSETGALSASDGANGDWFGHSVAILGNLALVGAPNHDSAGTDAGAVYVFTNSGGTWSQTAKLTASDATASANFGYSVAILSSTRVIVAAAGSSKLYTFTLSGSTWSQDTGAFTACSANVGSGLSVSGNLVLSGKTNGHVFDLADSDRSCVP